MPITLHTEETEKVPAQTELAVGRIRDDFQQSVDKDVEKLKLATAKAKWPEPDPTKLFHRYVVDTDDKGEMKSVIRRACTLHHVEAVFYKEVKTEAGHLVIKFHVARKLDKDNKPVKDDTLNADGTPKE
jgi:hypothetical protein